MNTFFYNRRKFEPAGSFADHGVYGSFKTVSGLLGRKLDMPFNYDKFYAKANCTDDVFRANGGKLYVPCTGGLFLLNI